MALFVGGPPTGPPIAAPAGAWRSCSRYAYGRAGASEARGAEEDAPGPEGAGAPQASSRARCSFPINS